MKLLCGKVFCWGGYWDILGEFFVTHDDTQSVGLFLMWSDITYNAEVGDLAVLGNF